MGDRLDALVAFLKTGIWVLPEQDLSRRKAFLVRTLKILLLALRGFRRDQCTVKASALTFYSLLSVVPIIAVFFGIAKGFGFDKKLQLQLLEKFPGQGDVLVKVFSFSNALLEKTKGGVVAGVGVALLFWSVVKVLGYIEDSFNDIWKIERPRPLGRKLTDYLSFTLVCPIIFVMSSSVTVTMAGRVKSVAAMVAAWGVPPVPILLLLKIIPFLLVWILFAFVLIFMPNTTVRWKSGIVAAVAAGSLYQLTQVAYVTFQVGVARANAIYGSFAALPLFLGWMQLSWVIVLLGAEIAYSVQNVEDDGFPDATGRISARQSKVVALLVARAIVRAFSEGKEPSTPSGIAADLGLPRRPVRRILSDLSSAGMLSAIAAARDGETGYQPARDIRGITVKTVLDALDRCGTIELPLPADGDARVVSETLDALGAVVERSPANRPLADL
jgi:membrane protein